MKQEVYVCFEKEDKTRRTCRDARPWFGKKVKWNENHTIYKIPSGKKLATPVCVRVFLSI